MSRRRRRPLEDAAQLLQLAVKPRAKSDLGREAGLNGIALQAQLEWLTEMNLLRKRGDSFQTTERGLEFLRQYKELMRMLGGD